VAIARATILRPTALLATADRQPRPPHRRRVMTLLENLHDAGTTLIVVTHDRGSVRAHRHITDARRRKSSATKK
jgi:putative ABC transport system ATP-binding protein